MLVSRGWFVRYCNHHPHKQKSPSTANHVAIRIDEILTMGIHRRACLAREKVKAVLAIWEGRTDDGNRHQPHMPGGAWQSLGNQLKGVRVGETVLDKTKNCVGMVGWRKT